MLDNWKNSELCDVLISFIPTPSLQLHSTLETNSCIVMEAVKPITLAAIGERRMGLKFL